MTPVQIEQKEKKLLRDRKVERAFECTNVAKFFVVLPKASAWRKQDARGVLWAATMEISEKGVYVNYELEQVWIYNGIYAIWVFQ